MHSPTPTPFQPIREATERQPRTSAHEAVTECITRTAEALLATGVATESEITAALNRTQQLLDSDQPVELIEQLARVQGHEEEHISFAIAALADAVASTLSPSPPMIPFAGKLIAPSAFYESFDALHQLARSLICPVIFAEDTDAIGVASINPIASVIFAEEVLATVDRRFGIKPFLTVTRMDYESWTFLSRKHFGL